MNIFAASLPLWAVTHIYQPLSRLPCGIQVTLWRCCISSSECYRTNSEYGKVSRDTQGARVYFTVSPAILSPELTYRKPYMIYMNRRNSDGDLIQTKRCDIWTIIAHMIPATDHSICAPSPLSTHTIFLLTFIIIEEMFTTWFCPARYSRIAARERLDICRAPCGSGSPKGSVAAGLSQGMPARGKTARHHQSGRPRIRLRTARASGQASRISVHAFHQREQSGEHAAFGSCRFGAPGIVGRDLARSKHAK